MKNNCRKCALLEPHFYKGFWENVECDECKKKSFKKLAKKVRAYLDSDKFKKQAEQFKKERAEIRKKRNK